MKKFLISFLFLFSLCGVGGTQTALFSGFQIQISRNIISDFGATCNGVADDSAAFTAFNTWAVANQGTSQIVLTIPSGANCNIASTTVRCDWNGNLKCPFVNIKNLVVAGGGSATTTLTLSDTNIVSLGGMGVVQDNKNSARAATVSAGASCVTLASTPTATISNMANNGAGLYRATVDSSAGFVSGQSYYFSSVGGVTVANGLHIVQVIDGTHLDLLDLGVAQVYTSGGAIGGDRTSLFTVGQYALMTGFDIQGLYLAGFGYPPNTHYFEYVLVASKNAGTGEVCFTSPLRNTYKSTWPIYNSGSIFEVDAGGPATLYFLGPSWDTVVEFRDLTISKTGQTYAGGRSVTYRNVTFTGANCGTPTQNALWQAINSNFSTCTIEVDKLITNLYISGSTFNKIKFQSSSTDTLTMINSTIVTDMSGTPKVANITGSSFSTLSPGAYAYGRSDETSCTSCAITTFGNLGYNTSTTGMSMAGGVISFANILNKAGGTPSVQTWAVPGTNIFWRGTLDTMGLFQVVDVTQDLTNTYVAVSAAGGFPAFPSLTTVKTHPAPRFTCTNCTGNSEVVGFGSAPARSPLFSYQTRTYTGAIGAAAQPVFTAWGNTSSITLDVTNAYSGAGALSFKLSTFNNWTTMLSTLATGSYNAAGGPLVNAKTAGSRIITLSGVTGTQAGDAGLAALDATTMWFGGNSNSGPIFSANVSASCPGVNCPSVTVTVQTDQGVVNP